MPFIYHESRDPYGRRSRRPGDPGGFDPYRPFLYAKIGDPRGAALIVKQWQDAQPRADKKEKRHGSMASWSSWRQVAAEALGALGGADEKAFLEEHAQATKDTYVKQACLAAAAAIGKRLAAKP